MNNIRAFVYGGRNSKPFFIKFSLFIEYKISVQLEN